MDQQVLLLITAAIALVSLMAALIANRRLTTTRRSLAVLQGSFEGRTLLDAVASYSHQVKDLRFDVEALSARQQEFINLLSRSSRNVGVIRYDAFEDMGGQMSFSAALLDDYGNGMVVTAINGRTEARTYAKEVEGGESDFNLSPEERKAISEAMNRSAKARR